MRCAKAGGARADDRDVNGGREGHECIYFVMPALVAGIHALICLISKTWMAGTSPAMTALIHSVSLWPHATAWRAFSARLRSLASRNFLRSRIDFGVTSTSS